MTLLVCWILFPVVLGGLALGCGLALERIGGVELPGTLLFGAGLAALIVVADFATQWDATAELAVPAVLVLAVAGLVTGRRRIRGAVVDRSAFAAAALAFALYAAPTVLSGEATFAGYLKIEDTAIWAGITDHVMANGRGVGGLDSSSFKEMLDLYLGNGYP